MKLALGTVQFGLPYGITNQSGQVRREEAEKILALAKEHGIDTLDTAIAYGESETCLGALGVAGFKVVTKLPAIPDDLDDVDGWVHAQVQASLHRLRTQKIYGLLLHRSEQLGGPQGDRILSAVDRLKTEGIVEKIGVSIYSPIELETVMRSCSIDLVQAPLSVIDRRLHESGWLQRLHSRGVEIHVRSAFLQGLLLLPRCAIPEKFALWNHLWDAWHDWLDTRHVSAARACVGFAQSFPEVGRVVVGVDSAVQFQELIVAADAEPLSGWPVVLSDDERLVNPSSWDHL